MKEDGPILIVGAGIGGLTLAHGLLRKGFDVRVIERVPEFRPSAERPAGQAPKED